MADWTDIPDENLLPGRPARSVDAIALRDNVTAQAEGAVGAPKSQTDSYADGSVTTDKLADGSVTTDKLADDSVTAGKLNPADWGAGAVGTYALLLYSVNENISPGQTRSGNLFFASSDGDFSTSASGTWRCMGRSVFDSGNLSRRVTLWLRIS